MYDAVELSVFNKASELLRDGDETSHFRAVHEALNHFNIKDQKERSRIISRYFQEVARKKKNKPQISFVIDAERLDLRHRKILGGDY